jgi:succinyl-CoA synthetase alpha subunit
MRSEAIVAKTKKLKAVWTPEFAQDLNAYQALDAEAELTSIMSEYISLEIDLEILRYVNRKTFLQLTLNTGVSY